MSDNFESQVLADTFEDVRSLTKFYLSRVEHVDPHRTYNVNGNELNCLYWIMGHIVWSEHFLIVEGMKGQRLDIPWLDLFARGTKHDLKAVGLPSVDEIRVAMDQVHEEARRTLLSLSSEDLDQPNHHGISFAAGNSRRTMIRHAIRHEPMHTGHISWIEKINKPK